MCPGSNRTPPPLLAHSYILTLLTPPGQTFAEACRAKILLDFRQFSPSVDFSHVTRARERSIHTLLHYEGNNNICVYKIES